MPDKQRDLLFLVGFKPKLTSTLFLRGGFFREKHRMDDDSS